jgi:branched-subunit amino acid aminotransferase/4-amino-4-deoxychorismate lyase
VARLAQSLQLLRGEASAACAPPLDAAGVAAAVAPTVRAALRAALPLCAAADPACELMLTVHVALQPGAPRVTAHACALPPPRDAPVAACVLGPRRPLPAAKASAWVTARQPLEAARPADCAETLLSDPPTGALLEGLVSNFFAVVRPARGPPAEQSGAPFAGAELRTASVVDGVLGGVARGALLQAAATLGLRVEEAAPVPPREGGDDEDVAWTEAFICNAPRGITPLRELRWLPGASGAEGADAAAPPRAPLRFEDAPGPVTRALQAALAAALPAALSPDFADEAETAAW